MQDDRTDLSRRRLLGGAATIGGAAALGGTGTLAFFSDEETFANNQLTAGELDMKVSWSEHYSDWSDDEDGSEDDGSEDNDVEVRMWDGPAGTTGGPGDLMQGETGLPTNDSWLIAVDDPVQFLENTETESAELPDNPCDGLDVPDDHDQPVIDISDVKPGDFGEVTFDFALCDNPGYVWLNGELLVASENGVTEPESKDPDEEEGVVELLDELQVAVWSDDGDDLKGSGEEYIAQGSLREVLTELQSDVGLALAGDIPAEEGGGTGRNCFSAVDSNETNDETHSIGFAWWLPIDHGNEVQSDSVAFDLGFYTEQCRHNDGSGQAPESDDGDTDGVDNFDYTFNSDDAVVGSSLEGIEVKYPDGTGAVSNASVDSVSLAGQDVSGDLLGTSVSNNGDTLTLIFGGSYSISAGDELALTLSGVKEPNSPYDVFIVTKTVMVNPQDGQTSFSYTF